MTTRELRPSEGSCFSVSATTTTTNEGERTIGEASKGLLRHEIRDQGRLGNERRERCARKKRGPGCVRPTPLVPATPIARATQTTQNHPERDARPGTRLNCKLPVLLAAVAPIYLTHAKPLGWQGKGRSGGAHPKKKEDREGDGRSPLQLQDTQQRVSRPPATGPCFLATISLSAGRRNQRTGADDRWRGVRMLPLDTSPSPTMAATIGLVGSGGQFFRAASRRERPPRLQPAVCWLLPNDDARAAIAPEDLVAIGGRPCFTPRLLLHNYEYLYQSRSLLVLVVDRWRYGWTVLVCGPSTQ